MNEWMAWIDGNGMVDILLMAFCRPKERYVWNGRNGHVGGGGGGGEKMKRRWKMRQLDGFFGS
jgi:hypothetical protein